MHSISKHFTSQSGHRNVTPSEGLICCLNTEGDDNGSTCYSLGGPGSAMSSPARSVMTRANSKYEARANNNFKVNHTAKLVLFAMDWGGGRSSWVWST